MDAYCTFMSICQSLWQHVIGISVTAGAISYQIFILYFIETFNFLFPSVVPLSMIFFFPHIFLLQLFQKVHKFKAKPRKITMLWYCFILQQSNLQGECEVLKRITNVRAVTLKSLVVYLYQPK